MRLRHRQDSGRFAIVVGVVALLSVVGCGGTELRARGSFPESGYITVEASSPRVCSMVVGALRESGADIAGSDDTAAYRLRVELEVVNPSGGKESGDGVAYSGGSEWSGHYSARDPIAWIFAALVLATGLLSSESDRTATSKWSMDPSGGPLVSLTLSVVDRHTRQELWRGTAREQVRDWRDARGKRQWIAKTVRKLVRESG